MRFYWLIMKRILLRQAAVKNSDVTAANILNFLANVRVCSQITGSLNWLVRSTCEMETNIVSVERIKEYTAIDREVRKYMASYNP